MTLDQYKSRRDQLISYMRMKTDQGNDWHAVMDSAADLRDLENY